MPHTDDTDRFCPVCRGARFFIDTSTHDYGYTATSRTPCWACHVPSGTPEPIIGPDALMDATLVRMGLTGSEWSTAA